MNFRELKSLVRQGEHGRLEFKRKAAYPEKIIKEVVAFANTEGGELLIGVDDDGKIPGLKFAEEDKYVLDKAIARYCSPDIHYTTEIIPLNESRSVIRYSINKSPEGPHYVQEPGAPQRKVYVRVNDQSIQASREVRQVLKGEKKSREVRFSFGEKEKQLMEFLDKKGSITVAQFAEIAGEPARKVSRTLVLLVLAGVLRIEPRTGQDLFMRKSEIPERTDR
ncbi:helix-turn-helix domain-containing protein [Roseivirga sp. BDSF3-8]|uniref:AlbA family DNA-binding domain-containing protein n=1 Tax=Roseivirga sp. BDSF3-8 TaxID=3241598 RepID=UPI0035320E51